MSERYQYQLELRLKKFAASVPGRIGEVESDDINEFLLGLKKKDGTALRGRTRNNYG